MPGEKNLDVLLRSMKPCLNDGVYVFCTIQDLDANIAADCLMMFREAEGMTVILEKDTAEKHGLHYAYACSWITLTVHSSLEAVGLTAAFSKALADERISCNVVAGYYHDHVFVHPGDAGRAMQILERLSAPR